MRNVSINPETLQVEAQQLGVDNIITLLAFILDIRIKIIALFQKFNVLKVVELGTEILRYGNVLALGNQAWKEFKDLKPNETEKVIAALKEKFELPDDQAAIEAQIEDGLELIPEGHTLVVANIKYGGKVIDYFQNKRIAA